MTIHANAGSRRSAAIRGVRHVALLAVVSTAALLANPGTAHANLPPPYTTQSHYVYSLATSGMTNLGTSDGQALGNRSGTYAYILDFGQPEGHGSASPGYSGYGMDYFASGAPFGSFSQIRAAANAYIQALYAYSGTAPIIQVDIGTNNYNECAGHTTVCSPSGFGTQFASMVKAIINDNVNTNGQIVIHAASDIETGYDSASRSTPLVQAYNAQAPTYFDDYGDAASSAGWTDAQIQYVAYGGPYEFATAQANTTGQDARWALVDKEYGIYFSGVITDGPFQNHDVPNTAYNNFQNALAAKGVSQSDLISLSHI